jgi:DNA modification methylase
MLDKIWNEDCFETMNRMPVGQCDVVLTSPFYNTNTKAGTSRTLTNTSVKEGQYDYVRYDSFVDTMDNDEYYAFTVRLFNAFDKIINANGVALYNISYGSENTECMFRAINDVITKSSFTIAEVIGWKTPTALPNSCSSNKLTRIFEFIFVFCRKEELKTFRCNKPISSTRKSGQKMYKNIYNIIEAPNNDGVCPYNKATYSSELCEKLLKLYAQTNGVVYDPFMGSGTTAVACKKLGFHFIGSEISDKQVKWANERIANTSMLWLDELLGGD